MGQWVNRSVGQWVTPAHAWVQLGLGAAPSSAPLSVQARAEAGLGDLGASPEELSSLRGFGVPRAVSLVSEHMRSPVALPAQVMVVADCLSSSWLHLAFDPQSWIKQKKKKKKTNPKPTKRTPKPTENTNQSEEPDLRGRQEQRGHGRVPCPRFPYPVRWARGQAVPPTLPGSPKLPLPPPVAAKRFSG